MIDNIIALEESFKNKENYIDKYYIKDSNLIIEKNIEIKNALMLANSEILENISAYKIATLAKNIKMQKSILLNILNLLKVKGINFTEFTSFWATKDISFSVYQKTLKTEVLKLEFLEKMIPEFIKDRHALYLTHGYSSSSMQVLSDSKAHKKNGNTGSKKVSDVLDSFGLKHFEGENIKDFSNSDMAYIYPDKQDKVIFKEILVYYKINFDWSKKHENKQTDFLFKIKNRIFILEHKHVKESGGGQDKQMSEIINFISFEEKNVSYVSFLDGVYFNLLSEDTLVSGKTFQQKKVIKEFLNKNKENYFVNTHGFKELLKSVI